MPKFQTMEAWQQAEALMQPTFIRLIANLTKFLEGSTWNGEYQDIQVWPEGTSEELKAKVTDLRSQLESASPEHADQITETLAQLPTPYPGHQLHLTQGDRQVNVDLWNLCYHVCFRDYDSATGTSRDSTGSVSNGVVIDTDLFDETGDIDWSRLDNKVRELVADLWFDQLNYSD